MTQIEFEARLSEIEADYSNRIAAHNQEIMNRKIRIEQLHAEHDMAVSNEKQQIINLESMISGLRAIKLEKKAEAYRQFTEEHPETL